MADPAEERDQWRFPRRIFMSELIGTGLLLLFGLSLVIFMFGAGSPIQWVVLNEGYRRCITGFVFGCFGALISLTWVGKERGAHLNPCVTLGFCPRGRLDARTAAVQVLAQLTGAVLFCLPTLGSRPGNFMVLPAAKPVQFRVYSPPNAD